LRLTRLRLASAWQPLRKHSRVGSRHYNPDFSIFKLATHRGSLAESGHENIYPTDYNSVSDLARDSLICPNNRLIARYSHRLCGSFKRPTESAGDDETNDGAGEIE
jgi:hypothetical protein